MEVVSVVSRKRKNEDPAGGSKKKRSKKIQSEAISELLTNYGHKYFKSSRKERNGLGETMAKSVKDKFGQDFTSHDIRTRLNTLKANYLLHKSKENQGQRIVWKHFAIMKKLIDNEEVEIPKVEPEELFADVEPADYSENRNEEEEELDEALDLRSVELVKQENENTSDSNSSSISPMPAHTLQTSHKTSPFFYDKNNDLSTLADFNFSSSTRVENQQVPDMAGKLNILINN